jgi:hypothetical protein
LRRAIFIGALAACNPQFAQPPSLVTEPRILAVRGEPAEVRPGTSARYRLLVATPDGTDPAYAAQWAYCNTPKPLDENNIVAGACLGSGAQSIGDGATIEADVPLKACQAFGPDPPQQMPGQPPLRPRDPDVSGGYYQPVRVTYGGETAFGLERITCNLAAAGAEIAIDFAKRYLPNQNPTLLPLTATQPLDGIPAGTQVTFTAAWTPESAESYPVYDLTALSLVDHRESLRVSWFATGGAFLHDRTGRGENEPDSSTDNVWTAPKTPGPVHLWLVLRDSRGGVDFAGYDLVVK